MMRARCQAQVSRAQTARQEALGWKPGGYQELSSRVNEAERNWMEAQASLRSGTYFGFLDSFTTAQRVVEQFGEISVARRISEEQALSEARSRVSSTLKAAGRDFRKRLTF